MLGAVIVRKKNNPAQIDGQHPESGTKTGNPAELHAVIDKDGMIKISARPAGK